MEIYNRFELVTMNPVFSTLMWRRRFSHAGEFQIETHFTPELYDIFAWRNITIAGDFTLEALLKAIISDNFLASAGALRSMAPLVRLLPFTLPAINLSVDYKNRNAYDIIASLLSEHGIGVKTHNNLRDKTFDIEIVQPHESDAIFSKTFSNILEQDYYEDIEHYKNVAVVGDNALIVNDTDYTGFKRREVSAYAPQEGGDALLREGQAALRDNAATRTLSSVIDPYSLQWAYTKDWDVGSIVTMENREIGYREREVITEITEFYDSAGLNLEVNTGDYMERGRR